MTKGEIEGKDDSVFEGSDLGEGRNSETLSIVPVLPVAEERSVLVQQSKPKRIGSIFKRTRK